MNPVRVLIIVVAAIAAIGLAFMMRGAFGGKPQTAAAPVAAPAAKTVRVLVAKRDLAIGDRIQAADLGWQDWPADALNPTLITDGAAPAVAAEKSNADKIATAAGDVIGGAGPMQDYVNAIVREPMLTGEPIMARKLVRTGEGGFLSVVLAPGKRAISMPVTVDTAAGGFILPGDRVDVVHNHEVTVMQAMAGGGQQQTQFAADTILSNIRVLAIDQATEAAKGAKSMIGATATLEVGAAEAEVLMRAKAQGSLALVLRSITDAGGPTGATGPKADDDTANLVRVYRAGKTEVVGVRP